jgi:hypothetical protein
MQKSIKVPLATNRSGGRKKEAVFHAKLPSIAGLPRLKAVYLKNGDAWRGGG